MSEQLPVGEPVDTPLPRPRPPRTPMEGRFCRLVPTDPTHAAELHTAFAGNDAGWTYLRPGPFASVEALRAWIEAACLGDDPLFHTIFSADGRPVGLASYLRIDAEYGVIEVGNIHFSPALQGTAAATEAMALMMARALGELGYRRYEWKCDALNEASRRAAIRLGFTYEGTFRQATVVKGRNRDTAWFSLLDREWPARRTAFAEWFAGLDAGGRQSTSLAR